ncbi:MAG: hypothetical protein ABW019_01470 [Chitinophagaceae bacterium]
MRLQNKSPHILSTSANLLGICFVVLTSLHILRLKAITLIDEFTAVAIVLFMASSILSFLSLRNTSRSEWYEKIADWVFLAGLIDLFIITMMIILGLVV